ncbi:MAG: SCO family protein [Acidobacteriota bacterium]
MNRRKPGFLAAVFVLVFAAGTGSAVAQYTAMGIPTEEAGAATHDRPGLAKKVTIQQHLEQQIPLDLKFRDSSGRVVTLGQYFGKKPVILTPVYYSCPMLCNVVLDGLVSSIRDLRFDLGKEYEIVTFSFDPKDTIAAAADKKDMLVKRYGRSGGAEGWHFLVSDQATIAKLTDAIGFRYAYDEKVGQFAHGAMIAVLTPEGKIARYFFGIQFPPRDLRFALIEASKHKIGTVTDEILLLCYHYDPATGKYSRVAMNFVRLGGLATVAGLGGFIFIMIRRERRQALEAGRKR